MEEAEEASGSPFRQALANITGTSWLDEAARRSLRAADAKFFSPTGADPVLVEDEATSLAGPGSLTDWLTRSSR